MSTSAIFSDLYKAGTKFVEEHEPELSVTTRRAITATIAPMEKTAMQSKAGAKLYKGYNNWRQKSSQLESEFIKKFEANKMQPTAVGLGPSTQKVISSPHEAATHARDVARKMIFGPKDENAVALLNAAKKEAGDTHAQFLASHLGVAFKDSAAQEGKAVGQSRLARNSIKYADQAEKQGLEENAFRPKKFGLFNSIDPYDPVSSGERNLNKIAYAALAPHAAIPHVAQNLNTMLADGLVAYAKGMNAIAPWNYEKSRAFLLEMDACAEISGFEARQAYSYQQSLLKKTVDKFSFVPDSIGEFIHRNWSMPGMSFVRQRTLVEAGIAAKHSIEGLSQQLMQGGDAGVKAERMLKEYRLDPDKIRMQGGKLEKDDYAKGLFHGIDKVAFLENPMRRSYLATATPWGRNVTMFHATISAQRQLISNTLKKQFAQKDYVGLARSIAVLGLIAPEAANALHFVSNMWAGHSYKSSKNDYLKLEEEMHGREGFKKAMFAHIEALSHFAAWGIVTGYSRQLARNKLAGAMVGPIGNAIAEHAEDTGKALKVDQNHPSAAKPLERDLLVDANLFTFGSGGLLSHKILPTKNEQNENKPKTLKQLRLAARRAAKRQPSSNPVRRFFEEP